VSCLASALIAGFDGSYCAAGIAAESGYFMSSNKRFTVLPIRLRSENDILNEVLANLTSMRVLLENRVAFSAASMRYPFFEKLKSNGSSTDRLLTFLKSFVLSSSTLQINISKPLSSAAMRDV